MGEVKNLGGVGCFFLLPKDQGGVEKHFGCSRTSVAFLLDQEVIWWKTIFWGCRAIFS